MVSRLTRSDLTGSHKVPTTLHAAITNLLVFHAFLDENPNYRATKYGYTNNNEPESEEIVEAPAAADTEVESAIAAGPATASDWGLKFPDLTESDMMNDLVVGERLLKLLDHPSLSNHLLRAKNLLPLLASLSCLGCKCEGVLTCQGWKAETALRHRRAAPRIVRAMVDAGQVEFVDVGVRSVRCIRLTKYNPERSSQPIPAVAAPKATVVRLHDPEKLGKFMSDRYWLMMQSDDTRNL